MPRAAMNEMTTMRWTFEEDVHHYADVGYDAIGIWRPKLSDYGEEKGMELLAESGMAVSSLHWIGGFTGSDGRGFLECVEDAISALRLAAEMNAACVVAHTGPRGGHTHNHVRRLIKSAFVELAPLAEELSIPIAIEPMHPLFAGEWTIATTLDEAIALLDDLDHPSLRLALDTYHMCQEGISPEKIALIAPRVATVHLGDSRQALGEEPCRCSLGEGRLPLSETIAALKEGGYDGYWEVELLGEDFEFAEYKTTITTARTALETLGC